MATYEQAVLADGPSNYWRLEELSGTTAVDSVGGADGTISGGVTLGQTGALVDGGKSMLFNGTTGKIVTASSVTVPVIATIEGWFKTSANAQKPFFANAGAPTTGEGVYVGIATNGRLFIYIDPSGDNSFTPSGGFSDNVWHHGVYTLNGTSASLYCDGVLLQSSTCTHTVDGVGSGSLGWAALTGEFWSGWIDEVAIYPYALNATQISSHYQIGAGTTIPSSRVRECVNAAVDALKVDTRLVDLLGVDKVQTHIKQGTDTPYAMVMGGDEVPWVVSFSMGDDASEGRQVDVLVQCVSTYRGSSEVDSIASRVMDVLTNDATWSGISGFSAVEFVRNAFQPPVDLNADGVLWFVRLVGVRVSLI